ncbi:MAG TPA: pseudouridine synthase [Polyangiaceae bacterium]|nr:pseudouridine synthase [Polyangiaceae bacterium]
MSSLGPVGSAPPLFLPRRLEKFLRDSTDLSVDDGRRAHALGQVSVIAAGASEPRQMRIDDLVYEDDTVLLNQVRLEPRSTHVTLMLNKPGDVTATLRDPHGQRDLTAFLEAMPQGVFPVGRLDRDTTGLLLFTNDGDLANAILMPAHETEKVYWLWLDEQVPDDDPRLQRCVEGVPLGAHLARATRVAVQHRTDSQTELLVTLCEGKNRQIRRMCRALDFKLTHLHRKSIGSLSLGALGVGEWRQLTAAEVEELWGAAGGRRRATARKLAALESRAREGRERGEPELRLEAWLERLRSG